jgi:peptidoglycan hydrolase-like protein with peptidoglycan-binding domain
MLRPLGLVISVEAMALCGCLMAVLAAGPVLAAPAGKAPAPSAALPDDADVADAPELDDASYRDLVADAQRLLRLHGFDPGPVDGQLGLRTRRAIRAYQAEARSRGVLEALKGPAPAERSVADLPGRPDPSRIEPAASAATD